MSEENVEVVRRLFDAFARGDIDALLELCDPDIVLTQTPDVETLGVPRQLRGHEGLLRAFPAWPEQWDDFKVTVRDRITEWRGFERESEPLEAAGLSG